MNRSLTILATLFLPISLSAATILVTGNTDPYASGAQLQAAVDSAQPGDTVLVSPNIFSGPITLKKKVNPMGQVITIQSSAPSQNLPGPGVRTGPAYSPFLPQITAQGGLAALTMESGTSYYNLVNLEFRPQDPGASYFSLLYLGTGGPEQSTLAAVPQFINIDRCYIHSYPNVNAKLGLQLNSANTRITNSYFAEFHSDFQDAGAITGINGPGPYQIINNYIEAAGVNILFGGAVPNIPGLVPSNILVAKNDFMKLLSYKNWDKVDPATYAAIVRADPNRAVVYRGRMIPNYVIHTIGAYTPIVKNMFELKIGQDVTVIANTFTNTYVQADQFGVPLALTPRTEGGAAPWITVQRVSIANNIFRHQAGVVLIASKDMGQTGPVTNGITFYNNLFDDIREDYSYDYERIFESYDITNLRMDHNTILGIGERNGITPLGGFVARMYADDPAALKKKYDLRKLKELDEMIASMVSIEIPYNNFVTGKYAFHHKAGMHTKAIYVNPNSYEILDPADFGLERTMNIAHRLTGHNAVGKRAEQLGLTFGKTELREITQKIKAMGDAGPLSMDQLDSVLREWVVA